MTRMIQFTVDSAKRYQSIDNFGASGAWSLDPIGREWNEEAKNRIADLLFSDDKGIGLTAWRFSVGAGSTESDLDIIPESDVWRRSEGFKTTENGQYDWNRHTGQQWFLRAALERGVSQFIALFYSPPVWMTRNGHSQPDPSVGTTNLKDGYEPQFAAYIVDILSYFQERCGIEFQYVSPINEPSWSWDKSNQEGNRYSNGDIKRVVTALYRELKQRGIAAKIDAPEAADIAYLLDADIYHDVTNKKGYKGHDNEGKYGGKYSEFIKEFLLDETMREMIGNKLCGHSYWNDSADLMLQMREALMVNLNKYHLNTRYWQTEYCILGSNGPGRDLGIESALYIAKVIHHDLTIANASAWHWWLAVSPHDYKDGLIYTDYKKPGDEPNVLPSKMLWTLGNYSRFIKPGAIRVHLSTDDMTGRIYGSAYMNESPDSIVFVFINDDEHDQLIKIRTDSSTRFPNTVIPYVTSSKENEDLAKQSPISLEDGYLLPGKSIVTFVGRRCNENGRDRA